MSGRAPNHDSKKVMGRYSRCLSAAVFVIVAIAVFGLAREARADSFEPDDSAAEARRVVVRDPAQLHSFGHADDEDWAIFFALPKVSYSIAATTVSLACDIQITLFEADGVTTRASANSGYLGEDELITVLELPCGFYYVRCRNMVPGVFGEDISYWLDVIQNTGAGLPIDTVDENMIGIEKIPEINGIHKTNVPLLKPGPYTTSTYTDHKISFPGYRQVAPNTSIDVKIRWIKDETEKYGQPGPVFPPASSALFVVEAVQWSDGVAHPYAFVDPVDITVQFNPAYDIVTFDGDLGAKPRMCIVRDMLDWPAVEFRFLEGDQTVDATSNTVTIRNYEGLTGASGVAAYGAASVPLSRTRYSHFYR